MSVITSSSSHREHSHSNSQMPFSRLFGSRSSRRTGSDLSSRSNSHTTSNPLAARRHGMSVSGKLPPGAPAAASRTPFSDPAPGPAPPTRRPQATPSELPPAYVEPMVESPDDPYAFLAKFDTVFLIDDSGSMAGRSWHETSAALATITPVCTARDRDGIDIHFLNCQRSFTNLTSADAVQRVFEQVRPGGGTPTGCRLRELLGPYVARVEAQAERVRRARAAGNAAPADEIKPMNVIVITDGAASDDVESEIMRIANKLEDADAPAWQVGIQFFQVGRELGAAEALQELDDELVDMGCRRDIVDTVSWKGGNSGTDCQLSADKILKCVLGAVVRKLDRKRNSAETDRHSHGKR